jgi:hypothetical protein
MTVHGEIELLRSSVAPQLRGPPQKVDWGAPRPAPSHGVRVGRRSGWVRLHPDLAAMPPLLYLGVLGYCWSWRGGVGSGRERAEHVAQGTVQSPHQPLVEPEKDILSPLVRCGTQCCVVVATVHVYAPYGCTTEPVEYRSPVRQPDARFLNRTVVARPCGTCLGNSLSALPIPRVVPLHSQTAVEPGGWWAANAPEGFPASFPRTVWPRK